MQLVAKLLLFCTFALSFCVDMDRAAHVPSRTVQATVFGVDHEETRRLPLCPRLQLHAGSSQNSRYATGGGRRLSHSCGGGDGCGSWGGGASCALTAEVTTKAELMGSAVAKSRAIRAQRSISLSTYRQPQNICSSRLGKAVVRTTL